MDSHHKRSVNTELWCFLWSQSKKLLNKQLSCWWFKRAWCLFGITRKHILLCSLQWSHNELDGISKHQPHDCLLKRLFIRRSKKTSKLRIAGLCEGNSPVTGEFPAQRASDAEHVSIWWRHHFSATGLAWTGPLWVSHCTWWALQMNFHEVVNWWMVCPYSPICSLTHCGLVTPYGDKSGSTLAQVMACCLTAPSHYLNQCWLIISEVQWHSY